MASPHGVKHCSIAIIDAAKTMITAGMAVDRTPMKHATMVSCSFKGITQPQHT